ncbi:MAG: hypothetical protein IJY57_03500 [Clostridia bacterium]|nr:hypothetical protein [Clostridia bacterium]
MSAQILTPTAVWGGFEITEQVLATVLKEKRIKDVVISTLDITGKTTENSSVIMRAHLAKNAQASVSGAILMALGANDDYDEKVVYDLAKSGYLVLSINPCGTNTELEYTSYPQELSYADYSLVKDNLYDLTFGIKKNCWYEWGVTLRYALKYLKSITGVAKVGVIGINHSATPLWQLASTDLEGIDCAVMVGNAGWSVYKGIHKWSGELDPQFNDDALKILAGIEPQAYAKSITCPVLMLSPTNSGEYDVDRAFDTVERVEGYSAVYYSVGHINGVDYNSYENIKEFFGKHLTLGARKTKLPSSPEIKAELVDGKFEFEVLPDKIRKEGEGLKEVFVYVSEGCIDPKYRSYYKVNGIEKGGKYYFEYTPYYQSKNIVAYANATYETGYTVSSPIICKKFNAEQIKKACKSTVVYSNRKINGESVFAGLTERLFDYENDGKVLVKNGPMDISGVRADKGLITFKVNAEKDCPKNDAILLLDLFLKEAGEFSVSLVCDMFGAKTEYKANVSVSGGKVWHNVMLEIGKFKSSEGRVLKNYQGINAIIFNCESTYLINNVLWI